MVLVLASKEELEPFKSFEEAMKQFSNLSEFVLSEKELLRLTRKAKDWNIENVPIKEVAQVFLVRT